MLSKDLWPELLRRAQERLAEREPDVVATPTRSMSAIGARLAPYLRADLVVSATLYRQADGWGVDIAFDRRRLPPGTASVIGTPSSTPMATPELAIEWGVETAIMLVENMSAAPAPAAPIAFELHGETLLVDDRVLEASSPVWQALTERFGEGAAAELGLGLLRAAWATLDVDMEGEMPTEAARDRLMSAICLCLHARITRYPLVESGTFPADGSMH